MISDSGYRYPLAAAYDCMLRGRADEAVRLLCNAAILYLRQCNADNSGDITQHQLLSGWPEHGAMISCKGSAIELVLQKENFSMLEAASYFRHFVSSISPDHSRQQKSRILRLPEVLLVPLLRFLRRRFSLDYNYCERRNFIWLLQKLQLAVTCPSPGYGEYRNLVALQLSYFLREPVKNALRIESRNRIFTQIMEQRRERDRSSLERRNYLSSFVWEQRSNYVCLQATDRRSRLVAAFHFGDFVNGLECFSAATVRQRRRKLIRFQDHSFNSRRHRYEEGETRRRALPDMVNSQHLDPMEAVAFLRRGNGNLTMFCDLPPGHGELVEVQFLGRSAWFTRGTAEIAMLARVPILPLVTYEEQGRNRIWLPGVLEAVAGKDESMSAAVARITQQLVNILESFVRKCPEQWYYLPRLSSYFVCSGGVDPLQI